MTEGGKCSRPSSPTYITRHTVRTGDGQEIVQVLGGCTGRPRAEE